MAYITPTELQPWIAQGTTRNLELVEQVAEVASAAVDDFCHRRFDNDTATTSRKFLVASCRTELHINDALAIQEVALDTAGGGVFTAVDADLYDELPLDGVGPDQRTGWPTTSIRWRGYREFYPYVHPSVQVSARWGWAAVPAPVKQATTILATELFHRKDTKLGVVNFGEAVALIGNDPQFARMLAPYRTSVDGFG